MSQKIRFIFLLLLLQLQQFAVAQDVRLVRSSSGPSGKVVGTQFVLDETRSRFTFPQDRMLLVVFEWQAAPGDHVMTATWKDPSGKPVYISPDVRVQTESREVRAYWSYELFANSMAGIWTIEIRMDGQPAGSHNFELLIPAQPVVAQAPSLNDIYRTTSQSLVWIHKLNAQNRRIDVSNGFVMGQDRIATAFQSIDASHAVDVEFPDGHTVRVEQMAGWNRLQDWAILSVPTGATPRLQLDPAVEIGVAEHYVVFSFEGSARTFGGIDVAGIKPDAVFGTRILLNPSLADEASGGPLMTLSGRVVGLLGGSVVPGSRNETKGVALRSARFWSGASNPGGAVPIMLLRESAPVSWEQLRSGSDLTPPMNPNENLVYGMTTLERKKGQTGTVNAVTEFSRQDSISVATTWRKAGKEGKGTVSARVLNAQNQVLVVVPPKKVSLNLEQSLIEFSFKLPGARGVHRVDVLWNNDIVWRTFVTVAD